MSETKTPQPSDDIRLLVPQQYRNNAYYCAGFEQGAAWEHARSLAREQSRRVAQPSSHAEPETPTPQDANAYTADWQRPDGSKVPKQGALEPQPSSQAGEPERCPTCGGKKARDTGINWCCKDMFHASSSQRTQLMVSLDGDIHEATPECFRKCKPYDVTGSLAKARSEGAEETEKPTRCPTCGSELKWAVLPKCHGGEADSWHSEAKK